MLKPRDPHRHTQTHPSPTHHYPPATLGVFKPECAYRLSVARALDTDGNRIVPAKETGGNLANIPKKATTPATYNVTMTNANTEYSQTLPANCKKFLIHTRDGTAFRLAFVTGKVATPTEPYFSIPANIPYWEDFIEPSSLTLYVACASAGKVIEIIAWS